VRYSKSLEAVFFKNGIAIEAVVSRLFPNYNLIQERYSQPFCFLEYELHETIISSAWLRCSTWMIMNKYEGLRRYDDCAFENLPGCRSGLIQYPHGYGINAQDLQFFVEHDAKEMFSVVGGHFISDYFYEVSGVSYLRSVLSEGSLSNDFAGQASE